MPVETEPEAGLRKLAPRADAVVDLADEPVVPASRKLRLAALALSLGLAYETPGGRLEPPSYEPVEFGGPTLAVIATGSGRARRRWRATGRRCSARRAWSP